MAKSTNMSLPEKTRRQLEELVERREASSMTEIVREAISLYSTVAEAVENGCEVFIKKKDGSIERVVLIS